MKRKNYYIITSLILSTFTVTALFSGCGNKTQDIKTQSEDNGISVEKTLNNDTGDNKKVVEEQIEKAKEAFARLLQDKDWLCKNTDYGTRNDVTFLILDSNQDGIPEMLLSYGNSDGEASHAISVVIYNSENNSTNVEKLSAAHGGYDGYISEDKAFIITKTNLGITRGTEYKIENNKCEEAYTFETNGGQVDQEKYYKINDKQVSKEDFDSFCAKLNNASRSDFGEINNENIKKYLNVEPTNKELTKEQAKQLLIKEDGEFIKKKEQIGDKFSDCTKVYGVGNQQYKQHYDLTTDIYYEFIISSSEGDTDYIYLVGKDTGVVYSMFNQGNAYAYEIQGNKIVKKLEWKDGKTSNDWRQN